MTEPAAEVAVTFEDIHLPPRFEPRRVIGRGGMGVVVEVLDRNLGREVAVKLLVSDKRDPMHRVRFRREARAAAVLRHPNIVTVHDVNTEHDFIVMELVTGESLRARLERERLLPPAEVRRIGFALLDGLAAAHDAKIVHRDVKPGNILIDERGTVKLVDFGIASFGDRDLTSTGVRIGTPAYMAPEQLRGRVADVRADLYAVGATLFEAATGVQLHAEDRSARQIHAAVLAASGDTALACAIERACAERPEDRFPDARAFAAAIRTRSDHSVVEAARRRRRWPFAIVAVALAAAGGSAIVAWRGDDRAASPPPSAGTVVDASPRLPAIAVLPFADHTREPRLDFAASGLPHILATELKTIPELKVVGYYELLDHISDPAAPVSEWRAAAGSLGAEVLVRGELFAESAGIRVVVDIESSRGPSLGRFERVAAVESVPEVTRAMARDVAHVAVGRATAAVGESRQFAVERNLQLGIAALERQDFAVADDLLHKVELEAPNLAEAQYYRALLNWWLPADVNGPVTRALAGNLTPAQRGFMEGLRLVYDQNHLTPAIDHFRPLAARYPDDREIQYGLFEALYHGGYPAEAMAVYRPLGDRHPRFRLGLKHALAYYIGHANDDGMRWATARLDPKLDESVLWQARALVARRDYRDAIALLRRHDTGDPAAIQAVRRELVGIYLLDGQLDLATDLSGKWGDEDVVHNAAGLLALSMLRGRSDEIENRSDLAVSAADLERGMDQRERGWPELAAIELPEARPAHLRRVAKRIDAHGTINMTIAYVLAAGALGDRAAAGAARASEFPEVVAVADAYRAEWASDWKSAQAAWGRAVERAADGNYLIVEQLGVARAARAAADHAAVLAACDAVIHPPRFAWVWGGAVGPCLRWSAEAASELGRRADARAYWERLLALRAQASPGDELVRAARAGLARSTP